ncbi:MAG: ISAzo13 family transposase, partial [Elusimicrobia bacterium CG_4_10_14_0_2_um_filter_63_34]
MESAQALRKKFSRIWRHLDERGRRMFAANEALQQGRGGISRVSRACGLSRVTITKGTREINGEPLPAGRIRCPGAGRPRHETRDPAFPGVLESLVEPLARGDPQSPLRWTCKSTRALATELTRKKHPISHEKVAQFLRDMNYSLQGNRKTKEGADHPDRDAQFEYINAQVGHAMAAGRPVISVDTKKKELIGNYENDGRRWRKSKSPEVVNGH